MTAKELEQIYNEAYKAVYWTAMQLLKNEADAEDVVQDTFVAFIESYSNLEDTSKAVALLKKIAANKSLNRLTAARTGDVDDEFLEEVEAVPEDFLPDSIVESQEARRIVMDIINGSLSDDIRRTLILFYFDDMSTKEIADALGVPQGTVLRRLNFARNKIKKEVEKYEEKNKTKLFTMALPFLSKLFMKEAEQVPFKAMPASIATLSASAEAPASGAGIQTAASAATKGTGIIMKKVIIAIIAASVAVSVTIAIIVGIAVSKKNTKPSKRIENKVQTSDATEPESQTTETTSENNAGTSKAKRTDFEYLLENKTDEEVADELFNIINSFHIGMTKEEWYKTIPVLPDEMDERNPGVIRYKNPDGFTWVLKDHMEEITTNYIVYPDGTFQIGPSKKIASLSLKCRLKDGARAKHIYDLLFEKMSAASESVSKDMVRNNEARNGGWDSYAMNTINGFTWRLGLSGHHELDLYENNDGGYTIDIEAYAMSWPGMNG